MFFHRRSSTSKPDRNCGGTIVVPFILAVPSLIRLRQCLIEYLRVRKANKKAGSSNANGNGWGGQHLANALKYSSAFPVILLSAMQRNYESGKYGLSEAGLYRFWYV
jgi:EXS family